METCAKCGAVVGHPAKHRRWHDDVDYIHVTADEALETAENAANTLLQNGIG